MDLKSFFEKDKKYALGFSGGVDSSYLLYEAKRLNVNIVPYFVKSQFQPQFELDDAKRLCNELNIDLSIIEIDVLQNTDIKNNPYNRCYYCKKAIFTALKVQAMADKCDVIIDGTNMSDEVSDRPGMKAINELDVKSPLRLAGLKKDEIRLLSKKANLFTYNKSAYACLATRIPTDTVITNEDLMKVEKSENALFELGFDDFRVRVQGKDAKIQFLSSDIEKAVAKRKEIIYALKPYFNEMLIYLEGRDEK